MGIHLLSCSLTRNLYPDCSAAAFCRPTFIKRICSENRADLTCSYFLLLRKQCRDIAQRFLRAVLVITILSNETLLNDRDLLSRIIVRARRGGHQSQNIATLLKQVLLDCLAHARMTRELELLARLEGHHGFANHLLPEGQLAGIGDLDLLLDRTQEALIGRPRLARNGISDLAVIQRSLDLVQILLQQLLRLLPQTRQTWRGGHPL